MGKKNKKNSIMELVNFIDIKDYPAFIYNLQSSIDISREFIDKLSDTDEGQAELKKYCGIDETFKIKISKEFSDMIIQMCGSEVLVQNWLKINIYDENNKIISRGETFYFDVENGKIKILDFYLESKEIFN